MEPNVLSISSDTRNVRQDVFPLDQWTITTRKGTIMQSKCTCKSAEQHQIKQTQNEIPPSTKLDLDTEPIELCTVCRYRRFLPQLSSMPDMLFNNNLLRLEHRDGVGIEFNPLDALRLVEATQDPLRVAVADGWQSARADCPFAKNISKPFDWTFTTHYRGTLLSAIRKSRPPKPLDKTQGRSSDKDKPTPDSEKKQNQEETTASNIEPNPTAGKSSSPSKSPSELTETSQASETPIQPTLALTDEHHCDDDRLFLTIEKTDERIDVDKLKVREEILFYDDVTLYEDELADHGTASFNVKVRVMPKSLFILARFFLRVDGVLARINDTRIYHDLGTNYILREYTNREARITNLNLSVKTVVNPTELMNHLPLIESSYEKLFLPKSSILDNC